MDKQYFNTVKARHVGKKGEIKGKEYTWHLPKKFRNRASIGSLVMVQSVNGKNKAIITKMYREDIEDTGIRYKNICSVKNVEKCIDLIGSIWSFKVNDKLTKKLMVVGSNMTSLIMGDGRKVTLNELENKWVKIR